MYVRALACGIPYDEIGQTRLIELERRWRAKELEVSLYARTQVELKMLDISARSLGEAEEPELETDEDKRKQQEADAAKHRRWEEVGGGIKAKIRESLLYSVLPEHEQAMHVYLRGWPDKEERKEPEVTPLEGMSKGAAKALVGLIEAKTFTFGEWANSEFQKDMQADGKEAQARLRKLAED